MNRWNRVIASAVLTAIAPLTCRGTVPGEDSTSTITVRTSESATFGDDSAGAPVEQTTIGEKVIGAILGRPPEAAADASPSTFVTATDASFAVAANAWSAPAPSVPAPSAPAPSSAGDGSGCGCNGCDCDGGRNGCKSFGDCFGCGRWLVEAEGVFLAPLQSQSFGTCQFLDINGTLIQAFPAANDNSFTFSPRFTLGWQGDCWGIEARYWQLQTGTLDPDFIVDHPFNGAFPGDGTAIESGFRGQTVDIEATRLLCVGCNGAEVLLSFGFRYAQLNESNGLQVTETNALGTYRGDIWTSHKFNGGGLTMGLRGIRPIGCSPLNVFFGARGSVLWDPTSANYVATSADFLTTDAYAHTFNGGYSEGRGNLFIGEIQGGLQWNAPLKCVRANAFARAAVEYQYWGSGSSGGVEAFSAAGPFSGPVVVASGKSIGNSSVSLVGFSLATGLTW